MSNVDNTHLLTLEILSFNNTKLEVLTTNTRMTVVALGSEKDGKWTCAALFSLGAAAQMPIDAASLPETPVSHQAADTHLLGVSPEGSITPVPHTIKRGQAESTPLPHFYSSVR